MCGTDASMTTIHCVTGMCPSDYFPMPKPSPTQIEDDRVQDYFRSLGYAVTEDSNRRTGESWHEILGVDGTEDGSLICQIDRWVPLADIVEDLTAMAGGAKVGTSKSDYKINVGEDDNPAFEKLCQKVAKKGIL